MDTTDRADTGSRPNEDAGGERRRRRNDDNQVSFFVVAFLIDLFCV